MGHDKMDGERITVVFSITVAHTICMKNQLIFPPSCRFLASASTFSALPPESCREVAFWGRSNVGKSSLLNALMGRKNLARCSKTPGCTKSFIFYEVHPLLHFVDLPGYGYAKAPSSMQEKWDYLMDAYVSSRRTLYHIYLLIDGRHGAKASDNMVRHFLEDKGKPYSLIFTKKDKTSPLTRQKCLDDVMTWNFSLPYFVSVKNMDGIAHLKSSIESQFLF